MLDLCFDDGTASWWLEPDGRWVRHHLDADGNPLRDLQGTLIGGRRRRRTTTGGTGPVPRPAGGAEENGADEAVG